MDTTMLIKTKKDLKLQAQELASELGFSLTDIVNASLRQFIINQGMTISKLPTETLDAHINSLWQNISKDKFLKSYNKSDAIYDQI